MRLLIVANCPSPNTRRLQQAVAAGARRAGTQVEADVREPLEADAEAVLGAAGVILGSTENFGSVSGLMKDFLERIYYPCLDRTQGLPVAIYIKGGLDGQGAKTDMERIITGLRWKHVRPALILTGDFKPEFEAECEELGALLAAGLEAGVF